MTLTVVALDLSLKLCECGCGAETPRAQRTNRARGYVKGQPVRFIPGHNIQTVPFWDRVQKGDPDA